MFEGSVNRVISKRITWLGVIALAAGIGLACQEQRSPTEPDPADLKPRLTLSGDTVVSGFGTPTIDGAITGAEWGSAGIIAVPVNVPGGGVAPGSLFVMNDANNLYVALQFQHSTSGGSLGVEFDNDADGTAEDGDDVILFNAGADDFFDDFRTSNATDPGICPNAAPASCGPQDTDDGGTEDGAGAFQDHGTFSIYEMSHPLDSADDDHDFSLTTASQVGAFLSLRIPDPGDGFADTDFPGFRDYMLIVLSGGVITLSLDNQGSPVVGQVVTAVERTRGPFRVDGSLATAVTDMNGTATIGGLPVPGDYCLHVRPLTSLDDAAAKGNNLVVPPGGAVPAAPTGRPAAIIDGVFDALPMTRDNYLAHCVDNPNTPPTVVLDGQNPEAALQRTIQPPSEGVTVKVNFLDLEGNPTFLPGWGIIGDPDDPVPLPWFRTSRRACRRM